MSPARLQHMARHLREMSSGTEHRRAWWGHGTGVRDKDAEGGYPGHPLGQGAGWHQSLDREETAAKEGACRGPGPGKRIPKHSCKDPKT